MIPQSSLSTIRFFNVILWYPYKSNFYGGKLLKSVINRWPLKLNVLSKGIAYDFNTVALQSLCVN